MDKRNSTRRVLSGLSATVLAASLGVGLGSGVASAAEVSATATHGDWDITRSISDGTPKVGDTITVTNIFKLNRAITPVVEKYKDLHDPCLTYVDKSAKLFKGNNGAAKDAVSIKTVESQADFVLATQDLWPSQVSFNTITYKVDYTVGAGCAGKTLQSTVHVSGNHNTNQSPQNFGPTIAVAETAPAAPSSIAVSPQSPNTNDVVKVTGKTSPKTEVTVKIGGQEFPGKSDGNGEFAIDTAKFGAGKHTATVTATNTAGSLSTTVDFTVTGAPVAPGKPTGIAISPQPIHDGDTVTVSGKAASGSTVNVDIAGKKCDTIAASDGKFSCEVGPLTVGTPIVKVTATNNGGTSPAAETPITVNAKPQPGAPAVAISPEAPVDGETVTVTVTQPDGVAGTAVSIKVDGVEICQNATLGANGTASCVTSALSHGEHTLVVQVGDGSAVSTTVNVAEKPAEGGDPGDGNGGGDGGNGGDECNMGSAGSMDLFGSLGSLMGC